jgi:hypothetical protein
VIAVLVNALAVDVFENEIRLACFGDPGVDEFGDVWIRQESEDSTFAAEAAFAGLAEEGDVEELQCDGALKPAVDAPRKPDASHSALANVRLDAKGADDLAGECGRGRRKIDAAALEKSVGRQEIVLVEKIFETAGDVGILGIDECAAALFIEI